MGLEVEGLAVLVDGDTGFWGGSPNRKPTCMVVLRFILSLVCGPEKLLLRVLGKDVHLGAFRRRCFGSLNKGWEVASKTSGSGRFGLESINELEVFTCLLLRCQRDRFEASGNANYSNTCEGGGGAYRSTSVTDGGGKLFNSSSDRNELLPIVPLRCSHRIPKLTTTSGTLVIPLCVGIAGLQMALQKLDPPIILGVCSGIDIRSWHMVRRWFPGLVEWDNIESVSEDDVIRLHQQIHHEEDLVHSGGGSPCQDRSGLLVGGKRPAGSRSKLVFEVPRIIAPVRKTFVDMSWVLFAENVFSMGFISIV